MARALLSDDDSDSSDHEIGGTEVAAQLQVNHEFAKRFEHNKKREERVRLEEKLGNPSNSSSRKRKRDDQAQLESTTESSSSEDEDEKGELATAALDDEITATLNAIRSKDPRVYDATTNFYTDFSVDAPHGAPLQHTKDKKEKPMYLRDYHRENLLNGFPDRPDDQVQVQVQVQPLSYQQEQDQLKRSIVSEMHAAADDDSDDSLSDPDGGLLVRKSKQSRRKPVSAVKVNVESADRDPETFLSNFMAARAWVPTDHAELHPFESDDEEDEKRAEEYEEAYNMRFENPEKSNEKLRSHARDVAAKYSVRREEKNARHKKREAEKAAKEAAKQELKEDKARLKKLRMDEVEEKVKRVKCAAGLKSSDLLPQDWARFIQDDWDDAKWEQEMERRFGDDYYADQDHMSLDSEHDDQAPDATRKSHKKPRKPTFDDDIDIKDIVPDFQDDQEDAANFSLTDDEELSKSLKKQKSNKQQRIDRQKDSRKDRRIIERLVDDQLQLELDHALPASSRAKSVGFRYRETSPQSFGLTSRDILLADDIALNQFAGLKKLASWRPEEKKQKDKKFLGKKARLRKWRLDTFGEEDGLEDTDLLPASGPNRLQGDRLTDAEDGDGGGVNIRDHGEKKKKARRRKKKINTEDVAI